jgi:effector-binding domain-containing protein
METIGATWQALHEHIEARDAHPSGPCREVYLAAPMDDPDAWVTELQPPIAGLG